MPRQSATLNDSQLQLLSIASVSAKHLNGRYVFETVNSPFEVKGQQPLQVGQTKLAQFMAWFVRRRHVHPIDTRNGSQTHPKIFDGTVT